MKPCPYCGHKIIKLDNWPVNDHHEYAGVCQNCGAQGPNDLGASGAMEMWEMRRSEDTLQAEATALRQRLQGTEMRLIESDRYLSEAVEELETVRQQRDTSRARVAELAAALQSGGSEYGDAQTVMEAIADSLEKMGVSGWPNFLRWKAEKERAALAQLPSPSGEDRGEAGE